MSSLSSAVAAGPWERARWAEGAAGDDEASGDSAGGTGGTRDTSTELVGGVRTASLAVGAAVWLVVRRTSLSIG